jgi:hypothetical protein
MLGAPDRDVDEGAAVDPVDAQQRELRRRHLTVVKLTGLAQIV